MSLVTRIALKCAECGEWYMGVPDLIRCNRCCKTCDGSGWAAESACAECNDDLFMPKPEAKP